MFKNLTDFWKGKDFLTQVLSDFESMLTYSEEMFTDVSKRLLAKRKESADTLREKIYRIDRKINSKERKIRKRILEHLSFQPTVDLNVSLVLMSVVNRTDIHELSGLHVDFLAGQFAHLPQDAQAEYLKFFKKMKVRSARIESAVFESLGQKQNTPVTDLICEALSSWMIKNKLAEI